MFLKPTSNSEIYEIRPINLKKKSVVGDKILKSVLKGGTHFNSKPLSYMVNQSFGSGPEILKFTITKPLYKKGNGN